jgi:hypothetical protein
MLQFFQRAGTTAHFTRGSGASMQNGKELWIPRIYFPMGKFGGPGARLVDRVHSGCTMDRVWACDGGSAELTGEGEEDETGP